MTMSVGDKLRIGRHLKVPHQQFLDAGRDAKNRFVALDLYMQTHGGHLPPNPAHPPSISDQVAHNLDRPLRHESRNGYDYGIDVIGRTREVTGKLKLDRLQPRSRAAQKAAGGADRLRSDHGGHYIARIFGGPAEAFNHFAQDAEFNKGAYRSLELKWEKAITAQQVVAVHVLPSYPGLSQRPSSIEVRWKIGSHAFKSTFRNGNGSKK